MSQWTNVEWRFPSLSLPLGFWETLQRSRKYVKRSRWNRFHWVFDKRLLHYTFELHYSVIDKTGESIIIEFTNQGRKIHENRLGVMTNSPPYHFHMLNLCNYVQLSKYAHERFVLGGTPFKPLGEGSGLLGMPGDLTPPSR